MINMKCNRILSRGKRKVWEKNVIFLGNVRKRNVLIKVKEDCFGLDWVRR